MQSNHVANILPVSGKAPFWDGMTTHQRPNPSKDDEISSDLIRLSQRLQAIKPYHLGIHRHQEMCHRSLLLWEVVKQVERVKPTLFPYIPSENFVEAKIPHAGDIGLSVLIQKCFSCGQPFFSSIPSTGWISGKHSCEIHESAHPIHQQLAQQRTIQHILVVEDDPTLAVLEAEILKAHGYTVVTVDSGELAITTLHRSMPDLIVLDLELTGQMNGWDVLQSLRRATASTPVLLTTSLTTTVRKYIRSQGETRLTLDHLPKPYPMQILLKRVKRMLMLAPQ